MLRGSVWVDELGEGSPVTLLAHGMGGAADDCRPWAKSLPGHSLLVELRGHGRSLPVPDGGWTYADYTADLKSVGDTFGATAAVGVSVSAGALLQWMAEAPSRFERVVLILPAALDSPRADDATRRLESLAHLAELQDATAIAAALIAELPAEVAESRLARIWAGRRARRIMSLPPPVPVRNLAPPLASRTQLSAVETEVLVIAEDRDPLHPLHVAEEIAEALPRATLHVGPHGSVHWTARDETTKLIVEHLAS